ncbi:MAG: glycosyltransferase [Verrucomicrobiota bacterium]
MRVLHVIPSLSPTEGGPSTALPLMTGALSQEGVEVVVATTDDAGHGIRKRTTTNRITFRDGAEIHHFPKQTEFYKVSLPLARWTSKHLESFDLVHVHALFSYASVTAARLALRSRKPFLIRPLGVLNRYGIENRRPLFKQLSLRFRESVLLRKANAVHFTSEQEREEAEELRIPMQSRIIPIGIPAPTSHAPSTEPGPYLLYLSRLDEKKNLASLLMAWAGLSRRWPSWRLKIAGAGNDHHIAYLRARAETLRVSSSVDWLGHLEGDKKRKALREASAFVLPSHSENFGIAAAEALACGLPSVLSSGVAVGREAADENACLLCDPSPESIETNLNHLVGNPVLRESLSNAARIFTREHYGVQKMGASLHSLYEEILLNAPEPR